MNIHKIDPIVVMCVYSGLIRCAMEHASDKCISVYVCISPQNVKGLCMN